MQEQEPLLSQRICGSLADDIAAGVIAPGTVLDEQQLADRFGTSRTPAREALRQLSADGLVEMRPRRGAVVALMSIERLTEMFEMSAEIEALCVRLAAHRMGALERVRLRRMQAEALVFVERDDVASYAAFNLAFHQAIYDGTHNSFIAEQALVMSNRMASFRRAQLLDSGRIGHSHDEHGGIVEAVMRGDGDEAARRMRAHMFNAAGALERHALETTPANGEGLRLGRNATAGKRAK